MRIAVLSDFHANIYALKKALKIIDKGGFDKMIMLGDILTYGTNVRETVDLVLERTCNKNTYLIKGNHDQIYNDIINSKNSEYFNSLPAWIKESVNFTFDQLDINKWKRLKFLDSYVLKKIFFSHANPFLKGDWTYLNTSKNLLRASQTLSKKGFLLGVFGHTHRVLNSIYSKKKLSTNFLLSSELDASKINIINTGSVGQSRNKKKLNSSFIVLNIRGNKDKNKKSLYSYEIKLFNYALDKHLRDIRKSSMTKNTKNELLSFY